MKITLNKYKNIIGSFNLIKVAYLVNRAKN